LERKIDVESLTFLLYLHVDIAFPRYCDTALEMKIGSKDGRRKFIDAQRAGAGYQRNRCIVAGLVLSIPRRGAKNKKTSLSTGILCGEYTMPELGRDKETQQGFRFMGPRSPRSKFSMVSIFSHGHADGPPVSPERGICNLNWSA
jgi:hypothetical protein